MRTNDGGAWQLNVYSRFTRFEENFSGVSTDRTTEIPTQLQKVPSTDVGGSLTYTAPRGAQHLLLVGSDFRLISGESRDSFFDDSGTINDQRTSQGRQTFTGLFVQDIYDPLPCLQLVSTLRADYFRNFSGSVIDTPVGAPQTTTSFPEHAHIAINPKLAMRYLLFEQLAVRAAGYRAYRAPTLSELYRRSSVEDLVLKENPNLGPE